MSSSFNLDPNQFQCVLVKMMLSQKPEERPTTEEILRHSIFKEAEQARIILEKLEKILIVKGGSGTQKTEVVVAMIREANETDKYSREKMLYVCASVGEQTYMEKQQLCEVWNVKTTDSLSDQQKGVLKEFDLVVVGTAHAIVPGEHWEENDNDLYNLLVTHTATSTAKVVIFLDPNREFKTFKYRMLEPLPEKLQKLAVKSAGTRLKAEEVQFYTLPRIRNSHNVNHKADKQKQIHLFETFSYESVTVSDDVTCFYMGSSVEEIAAHVNEILLKLIPLYENTSIVILYANFEGEDQLRDKLLSQVQNGQCYPTTKTVMCDPEEFLRGGVEADVVLFLFSPNWRLTDRGNDEYNMKCIDCVSVKGIQKLFLLPGDSTQREEQKCDMKLLLELSDPVSTHSLS